MRGGGYVLKTPARISEIECPRHQSVDNDYSSAEIKTLDKTKDVHLIHYY